MLESQDHRVDQSPGTSAAARRRSTRAVLVVLTAGYLLVIALFTLTPAQISPGMPLLERVLSILLGFGLSNWPPLSTLEFIANIALFLPLGALLAALFRPGRWWWAVLSGSAISGLVELMQLLFLPTRVSDVRDLTANTLGALIGAVVVVALRRAVRSPVRRTRRAAEASVEA